MRLIKSRRSVTDYFDPNPLEHAVPAQESLQYSYISEFVRRHVEHVAVDDDEVGKFPWLKRTYAVFFEAASAYYAYTA